MDNKQYYYIIGEDMHKYKFVKNGKKTRKFTTRKRRTTRARKGEKTLSGRQAYPKTVRRRAAARRIKERNWSW